MCGFVGYNKSEDLKDNDKIINSMLNSIRHRGPDEQMTYQDEDLALGFARLSIIDINNGTQPMKNEDETKILVFNGEIYNFKEIREKLLEKGHVFKTDTDSEVLLHGYEEYGIDLLKKLRGMFSFVIWDKIKKQIFGARDIFGIKPFYYYKANGAFIFGSEIKSFLNHPGFVKELNKDKLVDYMSYSCVPGYDTFFKNVYKLKPSHYFIYNIENEQLDINPYYEIKFEIDNEKTMEQFTQEIATYVEESVKAHEISDVEIGCFLSSGVDSSYVVREILKRRKPRTYTVGFEDKRFSEIDAVKEYCEEIQVENIHKYITDIEYLNSVNEVQYKMDEPLANPSANLLYFVAQLAAKDVKVVMSGERCR